MRIPSTTQYTIVFPLNNSSKTFESGFCTPMLTDGRAHPEEVNLLLREIETAQIPFSSKISKAFFWYFFSLTLASLGLVFFIKVIASKSQALTLVGVFGFMAIVLPVMNIFTKSVQRIKKEARDACQVIVDNANREFSYRGLRWHLPAQFPNWVELWKDYLSYPQMGQFNAQPIYMPPVNQQPYANYGVPNQMGQVSDMGMVQPQYQNNYHPDYQNIAGYIPPNQA